MFEVRSTRRGRTAVPCLILVLLFSPAEIFGKQAAAQQPSQPAPQPAVAQAPAAGKAWSVRMSKAAPHTFTVKAADARLSEIAGEISRLLKVPVALSPLLEKQ